MKYYLNNPCEVIAEINSDEVVIELLISEIVIYDNEYGDLVEPIYNKCIVNKKYITNEKIDFKFEYDKIINEAKENASLILKNAREEEKRISEKLNKQIEEINTYNNDTGFFKQYLDIVALDFEYIVCDEGCQENGKFIKKIYKKESFVKEGFNINYKFSMEKIYNSKKFDKKIFVYMQDYQEFHRYNNVVVFKMESELKEYLLKYLNGCKYVDKNSIKMLREYGIEHKLFKISNKIDKDKYLKSKKEKILELKSKIKELNNERQFT